MQYGTVHCSAVQYGAVRYSTVKYVTYGAVRCSTIQYGAVRYSTVQYGAVRCSACGNITNVMQEVTKGKGSTKGSTAPHTMLGIWGHCTAL